MLWVSVKIVFLFLKIRENVSVYLIGIFILLYCDSAATKKSLKKTLKMMLLSVPKGIICVRIAQVSVRLVLMM